MSRLGPCVSVTDLNLALRRFFAVLPSAIFLLASPQSLSSQSSVIRRSRAPIVILDSDRNKDGLRGAVRHVRTELAKEGRRRTLLEETVYDRAGRRVENLTYPVLHKALGEESYQYDATGQLVSALVRGDRGQILSETFYTYEFDSVGNWKKMTALIIVGRPHRETLKETEVTYRTIEYYPEQATSSDALVAHQSGTLPATGAQETSTSPASEKVGARAVANHSVRSMQRVETVAEFSVLNDKALSLPRPPPVGGPALRVPIVVTVQVVIDETGRVISAKAADGPARLRESAEVAARQAIFLPFRVSGRPVKVKGLLNYGFRFAPR